MNTDTRTIREHRTAAGLTQEQLADQLGVKANTVSRWELERMRISAEQLQAMARVFGVSMDAITLPDPEKETRPTWE